MYVFLICFIHFIRFVRCQTTFFVCKLFFCDFFYLFAKQWKHKMKQQQYYPSAPTPINTLPKHISPPKAAPDILENTQIIVFIFYIIVLCITMEFKWYYIY